MTSMEAGVLPVASPKSLAAGTPVAVQLVIPGFPGVRKANCSGVVRSWAKGKSVIEFSDVQRELTDRLSALFQTLIALQSEKSWQERQANLMMGKSYSVWQDRVMRTAILGALALANVALYFAIYYYLARPRLY
jgi:hypothetical protein